jgi:DNA processing protein
MSACRACLRRAWLLGALNGRLEYAGRDPERLVELLALPDAELVGAVGGVGAEQLLKRCAELAPEESPPAAGVRRVCRHDPGFPAALREGSGAPRLLHVAGSVERLRRALHEPTVAIVGARAASDYGMEVAHGLARGLAASGVTVVSGFAEGIAAAAHAGALEARGATVTAMAGGVDVCHPTSRRALYRRLRETSCALAELPCGERPRSWCHTARGRVVVALAQLVIVVEAGERPGEMLHARLAAMTATALAAVPGRVSSPLSRGPHALLRAGAQLVRDPQDALDALYGLGVAPRAAVRETASRGSPLAPGLRAVLEQVGAGRDTLAKLLAAGAPERETLLALAKLELSGAVVRGDAGRYVPRL